MVKVWNDNKYPYNEDFRGKKITIESGGFVEMDYDQAVLFLGTFVPIVRGKNGLQDPRSYKMLRIDHEDRKNYVLNNSLGDKDDTEKVFVCNACSKEFRTKKGLEKHIKDKHLNDMADDEARDELYDREDI